MGLLDQILYKRFIDRVRDTHVRPYWACKDSAARVRAFSQFARSPDVEKALVVLARNHAPDMIDNVFSHAVRDIDPQDVPGLARSVADSPAFLVMNSYAPTLAEEVLVTLAERSLEKDRAELLRILDRGTLVRVFGNEGSYHEARFFSRILEHLDESTAIAVLRASPSWKAINHRDQHFVEWIDDQDSRLLKALD